MAKKEKKESKEEVKEVKKEKKEKRKAEAEEQDTPEKKEKAGKEPTKDKLKDKRAAPAGDDAPDAKRQKGCDAGLAVEPAVAAAPVSSEKAVRKLRKKLGRTPTEAEVGAYIASKAATGTAPAAAAAEPAPRSEAEEKAVRKLTKKLGRAPTEAEIGAYVAEKADMGGNAPAAAPAEPASRSEAEEKAVRKLTKKLGRAPTEAEVGAYVAKKACKEETKEEKKEKGSDAMPPAAAAPAATASASACGGAEVASVSGGAAEAAWIDTPGEPPRKGQVPDGRGGWTWPAKAPETGNNTILLFYGYVTPVWTHAEHDAAMNFAWESLERNGCTGRLRCAREGLNGTLSGLHDGIRAFTRELAAWAPVHFGKTDFKYVDKQPDSQLLKELKVFPVAELVTYDFPRSAQASILAGGNHLKPSDYHVAMKDPNAVMIDVRNFNESVIGRFAPEGTEVLDPKMRRSTEFPSWVDKNLHKLKGKKVLMYCTGGIRCERASAYLVEKGLTDVNQLEGGIHRYLEEFEEDGGHWIGANYTFDKRFSHGAKNAKIISRCVLCDEPWERYAAQKKCKWCKLEVLVCRTCERKDKAKGAEKVPMDKEKLVCPLCATGNRKVNKYGVQG
ncbi:hypothetical protein FOA52_016098 [Chlamydomonas sp. UWO 241]|nr:hypothetical protein FOA52_016098 [Chlamydomonas sp. UWO 241]